MSTYLRLAGTAILADRSRLVWSVADGRRGRRWRAVASHDGAISHALLLEVDMEGRPSRLELTTEAGMLTLHPDETRRLLHGNVVAVDGVRHLQLSWSDEHGLEVEGQPLAAAVSAHGLARTTAVGEGRTIPVVAIAADLAVASAFRRFERLGESEWRIDDPDGAGQTAGGAGGGATLAVDPRGIPLGFHDAREWPLELD